MPAHTRADVWSNTSLFWQSGFHSLHRAAGPRFTGSLPFSSDTLCNYVEDAYSLLHKMPLKHLHSAKVRISVLHLAHTHEHYNKPRPQASLHYSCILSSSPHHRLKQTGKRAVAAQLSIPRILLLRGGGLFEVRVHKQQSVDPHV